MPITAMSPSRRTHSWSLVKRVSLIGASSWEMGAVSSAVIAGRNKGQRRDVRRPRHVAHDKLQRAAVAGLRRVDVAHRDRRANRGAEAAARHLSDWVAFWVEDRRAFARRGAAVGADADAPAAGSRSELAQDECDAGKAA